MAKDQATAPKTIKLFANRQQLGFDETESVECTQQLGLTEADYAVNGVTNLRFVKFQNVNSVVVCGCLCLCSCVRVHAQHLRPLTPSTTTIDLRPG